MKMVCAWCGQQVAGHDEDDGSDVSHGICEACAVKMEHTAQPLDRFLESLPGNSFIVDGNVQVLGANRAALDLVKARTQSDVVGHLGGEVLSCVYSEMTGGCGRQVHCLGCTIRQTVTETSATGVAHEDVQAFAHVRTDTGVTRVGLKLSTQPFGRSVVISLTKTGDAPKDED